MRRGLNMRDEASCSVCKGTESRFMISCDNCMYWVHYRCAKVNALLVNKIDKYYCPACIISDPNFKITWKNTKQALPSETKERYYFPITEIVRHKITRNWQRNFLVHWENYSSKDRTWEPEKNLDGCLQILQDYLHKKNLPYSSVDGLMGGVDGELNQFDERNWITMATTLQVFGEVAKEYFRGYDIFCQEYTGFLGPTGCYFLRFEHHCYAIFWNAEKQLATIGDGWNTYRKDPKVAAHISELLNVRIRAVCWLHTVAVDHCTSAAILINLELYRDYRACRFRVLIDTPPRMRERLIAKLHKFPSVKQKFDLCRKRHHCGFIWVFRVRKQYLCHRMKCGKEVN